MQVYVNNDTQTRHWPLLTDPATGQTVELAPGQQIELDLPSDFSDPYLQPLVLDTSDSLPVTAHTVEELEAQLHDAEATIHTLEEHQ